MAKLNNERLRKELDSIVSKGLKKGVFSAVCISFSRPGRVSRKRSVFSYGKKRKDENENKVDDKTFFDLASLTKPLVTTLSAAVLIEKGLLHPEDKLSDCCNWKLDGIKKEIKIVHLLSHSSGLPGHKPYYEKLYKISTGEKKEKLKEWILEEKLCFKPGENGLYSDLGFILLGFLIEEKSGESLDIFWEREIITPLKLQKELIFPPKRIFDMGECVATEKCMWTGQMLCGEVHDNNCRAMGGVAGHAGLFGTAPALLSLCEHLIEQVKGREEHPSYSSDVLKFLLKRTDNSNWTCGFDTVAKENSSSGRFFSNGSRGHLGFTGTSFWIDFERETAIVLLTNRVHMGSSLEEIRKLRPLLHDAIMRNAGFNSGLI